MKEQTIESQNSQLKKHLEKGFSITSLDALEKFGIFRLSARIFQLKRPPYEMKIEKHTIHVKNRFNKVCRITRYQAILPYPTIAA